jgi:hypothetical protein
MRAAGRLVLDLTRLFSFGSIDPGRPRAQLREVAVESTRFYIRHLTPSKQLCYFHVLLTEMGRIQAQEHEHEQEQQ